MKDVRSNAGSLRGLTLTNGREDADFGGAIFNSGNLTISSSSLTANTAVWGGAIHNSSGVVTVAGGTLAGNDASLGFGGAIAIIGGAVTITASTLSDNRAQSGWAAFQTQGSLAITTSTLAGNSAGFAGTLDNSSGGMVLTANVLSGSSLCEIGNPTTDPITSSGYNVASDASCNLTAAGDVQNTDPLLGPLANNGGPTQTRMPLPGSPAIDRVPNAVCTPLAAANDYQDQRGAPRPQSNGASCDSGAVELQNDNFFCVGERSGALRYISVPNGCIRGELRLLPTADGSYAFCVGDRSGSMRYLFNAATNCLRGETKLVLPQVEPTTICVGERSRAVRYVAQGGCLRGELAYGIINPVG